jgi:NADH-quinone oxidoreductase subunit J
MSGELIIFWILAIVSVGAALLMISVKNPVRSALYLVVTFLCVAAFYVTLSAQFIAVVQIIVYAGAIMVLFLFVIMLLNLGAPEALRETGQLNRLGALVLTIIFAAVLLASRSIVAVPTTPANADTVARIGTVEAIGLSLFDPKQPWLFPFEITSILLLVAVIGAIILAKRRV